LAPISPILDHVEGAALSRVVESQRTRRPWWGRLKNTTRVHMIQ